MTRKVLPQTRQHPKNAAKGSAEEREEFMRSIRETRRPHASPSLDRLRRRCRSAAAARHLELAEAHLEAVLLERGARGIARVEVEQRERGPRVRRDRGGERRFERSRRS